MNLKTYLGEPTTGNDPVPRIVPLEGQTDDFVLLPGDLVVYCYQPTTTCGMVIAVDPMIGQITVLWSVSPKLVFCFPNVRKVVPTLMSVPDALMSVRTGRSHKHRSST